MTLRDYPGEEVVVLWDTDLCVHSATCYRELPAAFKPTQRPWVQPGNVPVDVLVAQVERCPSRALTYRLTRADEAGGTADGRVDEAGAAGEPERPVAQEPDGVPDVAQEPDGVPDVAQEPDGVPDVAPEPDAALDLLPPPDAPASADASRVVVTVQPDGPYLVRGEVEVRTPDGRVVTTARRLALCRCGRSASKPFCDGSHARTGFRDPGPGAAGSDPD